MSELVTVTRKPATIQAYQLTTPGDMLAALEYIINSPRYSGSIICQRTADGVTWQLLLNNVLNNVSSFGQIGDYVIIENSATASICPAADYAALYQA